MILIRTNLVHRISFGFAKAIALYPFVLVERDLPANEFLLNHERIHLRQQLELLVLPFYLIYAIEFLFHWLRHRNRAIAYSNISFEREAYRNDKDLSYLKTRPFWAFLRHYS